MTETTHTRSRRTSLFGLVLQAVVFGGVLLLSQVIHSPALFALSWFLGGGILLWFVSLLVFRQQELAALEALDLEELRREKAATGGASEAMFDERGGGGFRVAEARLEWMRRWLIPTFALLQVLYLAGLGVYLWFALPAINVYDAAPLIKPSVPFAMIVLAVVLLLLFLFSRYSAGLGRVAEWKLLRACGSYMLGNVLAVLAAIICLGVYYFESDWIIAERILAYVIVGLMILLAAETLVSFTLDIYRPRTPGVAPRAAFDSRLLALVAEPGGIASTIAEAVNYQFGFEVSQTWFYQLIQRTVIPLLFVGGVILWLLTCVVIVRPGQHAIIERFGRQLNAAEPYGPGFYWKWPAPFDVAYKYDTGRLHQFTVGFEQFDAEAEHGEEDAKRVALWTDDRHFGQPHFDFLIPIPPAVRAVEPDRARLALGRSDEGDRELPVNMVRMDVAVQYRIREADLEHFTQTSAHPHEALLNIAWHAVVKYLASKDIFALLGEEYAAAGPELHRRIQAQVDTLELGLEIVYVGVQNVHPEADVSKAFRAVVTAEQQKIAEVREALVRENEVLSAVAGGRDVAQALAEAIDRLGPNTTRQQTAVQELADLEPDRLAELRQEFAAAREPLLELMAARARLEQAQRQREMIELDLELGLGRNLEERRAARAAVRAAEDAVVALEQELTATLATLRTEVAEEIGASDAVALEQLVRSDVALSFWNDRLRDLLPAVQGDAAEMLAQAQATRWQEELGTAQVVARIEGERAAYHAAPEIYKLRKYLEVLTEGLSNARKFFLAFDPDGRTVSTRIIAEEKARADDTNFPSRAR